MFYGWVEPVKLPKVKEMYIGMHDLKLLGVTPLSVRKLRKVVYVIIVTF